MKKALLAICALLVAGAAVVSLSSAKSNPVQEVRYGYGVVVKPDKEFGDFVECGLNMYRLDGEEWGAGLPALRIMAGTANSMRATDENGTEYLFRCALGKDKSEVSYEIEGSREGAIVLSHTGVVSFE